MAKIANVALTNTFNTWRTNSNISFDRLSQFAINNSSLYANTITANVAFTSTGLATLSGRATVGTNLTVSGNTTSTGVFSAQAGGTAGAPSITFIGDTDTGIARVAANQFIASSNGTEVFRVAPAAFSITAATKIGSTGTNGVLDLARTSDGATISTFKTDGTSGIIDSATSTAFQINTTEAMSIDSSRNILINGSGANGVYSNTASFGVFSNNVNFSSKKIRNFTEDAMSYRASSTAITLSEVRNVQRVSLTGNATVTLPTGMPGKAEAIKTLVVIFKQDATGSRTMAFAAPAGETLLYNNSATLPAVSSAANKVTIYVCTKFDGDTRWYISQSFIEA